ncbi:MAG: DUF1287 domain-containing protein [Blastopirellula sp.]|nr:MAG: DUF1287 domain-containing protein [Blastopirellula sp.]
MIIIRLLLITLLAFTPNAFSETFETDIVQAALERTQHNVRYDGSYMSIPYPNGDVPANIGVCTDVIIRTYRAIGTDLQKLVHEDMLANFGAYPSKRIWGMSSTDKNIDHRRVPNLQAFLSRKGEKLAVSNDASDYKAGDIVTWMLTGNLPHIGLITNNVSSISNNPLVVHNIGAGPKLDDMLFSYKITGHYRYVPSKYRESSL